MNHARAVRQLSAYLDEELSPSEMRAVAAHVAGCEACRDELAALRRVKDLLGRLPEVEPPAELWAGVRARAERTRHPASAVLEMLRGAFRRPAAAAVAAMVVLILAAAPLVKGRLDRLQAADIGVDLYVREHAVRAAADPFVDRAYLGLLIGDANLALAGARRVPGEGP
jgi:anti-sigma factor RsiW